MQVNVFGYENSIYDQTLDLLIITKKANLTMY